MEYTYTWSNVSAKRQIVVVDVGGKTDIKWLAFFGDDPDTRVYSTVSEDEAVGILVSTSNAYDIKVIEC